MLHYCAFCNYSSVRLLNLERHTQSRHNVAPKESIIDTICEYCNKSFSNKANLKTHIKTCSVRKVIHCMAHAVIMTISSSIVLPNPKNVFLAEHLGTYQTIVRNFIHIIFSEYANRNIYITNIRSGICWVLGNTGTWEKMKTKEALRIITSKIIRYMTDVVIPSANGINDTRFTSFKKLWETRFKLLYVFSKNYINIQSLVRDEIHKYSIETFPKTFTPFVCNYYYDVEDVKQRAIEETRRTNTNFFVWRD